MKTNWQYLKLSEACELMPPKKEVKLHLSDNDLVSFVPMESLGQYKKDLDLNVVKKLNEVYSGYTYFKNGDVLLAKITPCFENGKLGIANNLQNGVGFGSSEYFVFRPNKYLLPQYLFYYLSDNNFRIKGKNSMYGAAGHKRLSKEFLDNYLIPIPSLDEQRVITGIVDEVFGRVTTTIEIAEKNLQNARELYETYLMDIFAQSGEDWVMKTLGDVCSLYQGIAINAKTKHALVEKSDLPLLRIKDLKNNTVEQYIDPNNYPVNALVNESDIIYTRTGSLGLVFRGRKGVLHNNSFKVIPNSELDRDFLFIWLQNPIFKSKIMELALKAAQPDITHAIFKVQKIVIPPIKEQKYIVRNIEALSDETKKLETIHKEKVSYLEELKKSVLHQAFQGELHA